MELYTEAFRTVLDIAGPAASRIQYDSLLRRVDTSNLTPADLAFNEGAKLINDLATSANQYLFEEGQTVSTLAGQQPYRLPSHAQNLNNSPDWRAPRGKGPESRPPAGFDAVISVDPTVTRVDRESFSRNISQTAAAFHELAESFGMVDLGMPYSQQGGGPGAHAYAVERERILLQQRPHLTEYPAGGRVVGIP